MPVIKLVLSLVCLEVMAMCVYYFHDTCVLRRNKTDAATVKLMGQAWCDKVARTSCLFGYGFLLMGIAELALLWWIIQL